MTLDFAFTADAATVDGGGKLNVLGIFDRIRVRELPARHRRLALVLRLSAVAADAGEHEMEIQLRDPDGESVVRLDGKIRTGRPPTGSPDGVVRLPHVLNLDGITFKSEGVHHFEIGIDGELVSTLPLVVQRRADEGRRKDEGVPVVFAPGGPAQA